MNIRVVLLFVFAAAHLLAWQVAAQLVVLPPTQAEAVTTQCRVYIEGRAKDGGTLEATVGFTSVVVECTGSSSGVAVNEVLVQSDSPRLTGVGRGCNNSATGPHGCLLTACGKSRVRIAGSSIKHVRFDSTSSPITHAICVVDSSQLTLDDSVVDSNSFSAVLATDDAYLAIAASRLIGNTGKGYAGGVTGIRNASMVILNTVVHGNEMFNMQTRPSIGPVVGPIVGPSLAPSPGLGMKQEPYVATTGAGLHVGGTSKAVVAASTVSNNKCQLCCGGGVGVVSHGSLTVTNGSVISGNGASIGGGGVCVQGSSTVMLEGASSITSNEADDTGGGLRVSGNSSVTITDGSLVGNNTSIMPTQVAGSGSGGGGASLGDTARLLVMNGTRFVGNRALKGGGGAILSSNMSSVTIAAGVYFADNFANTMGPDIATWDQATLVIGHDVMHEQGQMSRCSETVYLGRTPCGAGEYIVADACQCCPVYTYGFEPDITDCRQCPANAFCSGDRVVPVVGFWHSSPRSVQMHKCPLGTLSCGDNGTCLAGYTGHLCGACREGYGLSLPLRCSKCLAAGQQVALYVLMFCGCSALVAYTVHATWQDNKAGGKDLRPSDLLKVLAQFLQYLVILGSISAPWPAFLGSWFAAAAVVFGATGGQSSLDCWLKQLRTDTRLPLAIQRQLVAFLAPVGVLLAVVLLLLVFHWLGVASRMCCVGGRVRGRQRSSSVVFAEVLTRLRVAMLVVAFYAYPTLVKASLSFFACLPVDTTGKQPYPEYAVATHPSGYWVSDIQQECFAGWHKPWALGLGLPTAVVLCVGVPVVLLWFLWANAYRSTQPSFQELYGFLYRHYNDRRLWWEAVWALQTVVLTAVSVFHFTLRAYYALLLMGLVLLLSAAVQQAAQPYRHKQLHRLHMGGTACLYLNIWLALNLFAFEGDEPSLTPLHTAVGAIMVVLDAAFVAWCVCSIARLAHPTLQPVLHKAVGWVKKRALSLPCSTAGARVCCC